jgi:hypothetical protein
MLYNMIYTMLCNIIRSVLRNMLHAKKSPSPPPFLAWIGQPAEPVYSTITWLVRPHHWRGPCHVSGGAHRWPLLGGRGCAEDERWAADFDSCGGPVFLGRILGVPGQHLVRNVLYAGTCKQSCVRAISKRPKYRIAGNSTLLTGSTSLSTDFNRQGGPKQRTAGDSSNKHFWFRKSASLFANHCISRADRTFMKYSATKWTRLNQVTSWKPEAKQKHETSMWLRKTWSKNKRKTEAKQKHETSMWLKLTYINPNVLQFQSQEFFLMSILRNRWGSSGNNTLLMIRSQDQTKHWLGKLSTGEPTHFKLDSSVTAVLVKKWFLLGTIITILGRWIH